MIRSLLALGALLPLALCAPPDIGDARFRDSSAPIASIALFEPSRLSGSWVERARFATLPGAGCALCRVTVAPGPSGGLRLTSGSETGALVPVGPGRLRWETPQGSEIWWVLWVDADYRTVVIGDPEGRFGMVLDRSGRGAGDRMRAARSVLQAAGYDLRFLQDVS